jgi:hypothetical protein
MNRPASWLSGESAHAVTGPWAAARMPRNYRVSDGSGSTKGIFVACLKLAVKIRANLREYLPRIALGLTQ